MRAAQRDPVTAARRAADLDRRARASQAGAAAEKRRLFADVARLVAQAHERDARTIRTALPCLSVARASRRSSRPRPPRAPASAATAVAAPGRAPRPTASNPTVTLQVPGLAAGPPLERG
jgi:hypothetical protein